jgi:uncharacterized protein
MPDKLIAAQIFEAVTVCAGAGVLAYHLLSKTARARAAQPAPLPFWEVPAYSFAFACVLVLGVGAMFRSFVFSLTKDALPVSSTLGKVIDMLATHSGFILGIVAGWFLLKRARFHAEIMRRSPLPALPAPLAWKHVPLAILATLCVLLFFKSPFFVLSAGLLKLLGQPVNPQEAVTFFAGISSTREIVIFMLAACVAAPVAEEYVFRAGLFRFVRGRIPRWIAFSVPALLFTSLHFSLPAVLSLFFFGVVQSFVYERTGRIAIPIIAHALYNLHTTVFVLNQLDVYKPFTG